MHMWMNFVLTLAPLPLPPAEAFYGILKEVRAATPARSTMFMTEGIVEEVQGVGFDILLGQPPLTHRHKCLLSPPWPRSNQHAVIDPQKQQCQTSHRFLSHAPFQKRRRRNRKKKKK